MVIKLKSSIINNKNCNKIKKRKVKIHGMRFRERNREKYNK